jgi:hypothetical protein
MSIALKHYANTDNLDDYLTKLTQNYGELQLPEMIDFVGNGWQE